MSNETKKIPNKRFEAMRLQVKNTLFEATTELTSPKSLKQALASQEKAPQIMRKLPSNGEEPSLEANPCYEQGKWKKMGEITQKRNFEMMRSNLKMLVFGKADTSPTRNTQGDTNIQDTPNNGTETVKEQLRERRVTDLTEIKTADSINSNQGSKEDSPVLNTNNDTAVLHSLIPPRNSNEERKENAFGIRPINAVEQEEREIEDVTPRSHLIFKKFQYPTNEEADEQFPEDANIFYVESKFQELYNEMEILGEGTSGVVKRCVRIATGDQFAVKIINYKGDDEIKTLVVKEFRNHRKLKHKNIVAVYELYIDTMRNKIYTVMELVRCREIFDVIQELGSFCEADASRIFKQIVLAMQYMHSNGVCHRDLKPNNILASNDGKIVKITDFNVSKFIDKGKKQYTGLSNANYKMWTYTGTIAFTAPEVLADTEYTEIVDAWSAGCVLYTMLCGYQPFQAEYLNDLIPKIIAGDVVYNPKHWSKISPEAVDLIQKLLEKDPKKRLSPSQALSHVWICDVGSVPCTNIADLTTSLKDNAKKNSRAACLAGRTIQSSLLPKKKKKSPESKLKPLQKKAAENLTEEKTIEEDPDEFPDISSLEKFNSEGHAKN